MLPPFVKVAMELRRARRAGEADHIPLGGRGIPFSVLFGDALPGAKPYQRKLAVAISAFAAFLAIAMLVMALFGPHHQ